MEKYTKTIAVISFILGSCLGLTASYEGTKEVNNNPSLDEITEYRENPLRNADAQCSRDIEKISKLSAKIVELEKLLLSQSNNEMNAPINEGYHRFNSKKVMVDPADFEKFSFSASDSENKEELRNIMLKNSWEDSPENLAEIIKSNDSDLIIYTALEIAQEGFGLTNTFEVKKVSIAFSEVYEKTDNEELKNEIIDYLSNVEPDLFDEIYSNLSLELRTAINDYVSQIRPDS